MKKKLKVKSATQAPKNPFVVLLTKRPSGPQMKPYKAIRSKYKSKMRNLEND